MTREDDLRIRPGRIRSTRAPRTKPFVAQVLTAPQKAGGLSRGKDGMAESLDAAAPRASLRHGFSTPAAAVLRSRRGWCGGCVRRACCAPISVTCSATESHETALRANYSTPRRMMRTVAPSSRVARVTAIILGSLSRLIAGELASLRSFSRELMDQASRDPGTRLDWWRSTTRIQSIRTFTSSCGAVPMMVPTSSSVAVISLWACAPAPATLSCANLALVRSSRLARALRRTRQPNAGPHSIGRLPGKRGRRTALSI